MANKAASTDKVAQGTLQRGKACLRCRYVTSYFLLLMFDMLICCFRKRKMVQIFILSITINVDSDDVIIIAV